MVVLSKTEIEELKNSIDATIRELDIPTKKAKLIGLEGDSMDEGMWKDVEKMKGIMTEIESLKHEIAKAEKLSNDVNTLLELHGLMPESDRRDMLPEFERIKKEFAEFEKLKFLSGKYDKSSCLLSIHAGQGGTEANDWAEMLMRMYTRYCEKKGWKVIILHIVRGGEVGISSVDLMVEGTYAYGLLKMEKGTHRLVRLSPFNAANLRQTSFAGVEVMPVLPDDDNEIVIKPEDIEFKAVRASGAGGQKVNKTSSAVQITHIPTGISVHCSEERSQPQNRERAMNMLKAKLWQIEEDKRQAEIAGIKGEHKIAGWGNQIRNYVLHPYKLVKDLRTEVETSNPEEVLNGELDPFIEAEIKCLN